MQDTYIPYICVGLSSLDELWRTVFSVCEQMKLIHNDGKFQSLAHLLEKRVYNKGWINFSNESSL